MESKYLKKFGFTLAEILITLAIIGTVVAITIPTVSQKTNNKQFKVRADKQLAILNNIMKKRYVMYDDKIDYYRDANDLKTNFFFKNFIILYNDDEISNDWGNGINVETSFYMNDGSKYCISEKITNSCKYDKHNTDTNIPCYMIYVDTNGDKKPNKLTQNNDLYKDIVMFYAYSDRFVLQPGENNYSEDTTPEDTTPEDTTPEDTTPEDTTPEDNTPEDTTPEDNTPEDTTPEDNNNNNEHKMERCLEKKSYEECVTFCEKNGYHSALCR